MLHSHQQCRRVPLLHVLAGIWCCPCPDFGRSNRCALIARCCFNLRFPDDIGCGTSLHGLTCYLCIFFGEVSAKVFGPFLNWIVDFLIVELSKFCVFWITISYHTHTRSVKVPVESRWDTFSRCSVRMASSTDWESMTP